MSIDQYGLHVGPLYIHFYALLLLTGLIVGAWITARRARERGFDPDHVWNAILWAAIPGLIGARLYHVLTPTPGSGLSTDYYFQHPEQILAIWNGGLGIYGAVAGGLLGIWLYARKHKQPLLPWLDLAVPGLALAQAIGRWGNFVNQEVYGQPSTLPWAIYISPDKRLPGYEQYATYHPLFLYESILDALSFVALLWIERRFRKWLRPGDLILCYMLMYPPIRSALDLLRLDSAGIGSLTIAQIVSGPLVVGALAILIIRHRRPVPPAKSTPSAPPLDKPAPQKGS
ncbi:MAG: prolipoprotein diacylglyceryl transferase [Aggregatilineales bacterium]